MKPLEPARGVLCSVIGRSGGLSPPFKIVVPSCLCWRPSTPNCCHLSDIASRMVVTPQLSHPQWLLLLPSDFAHPMVAIPRVSYPQWLLLLRYSIPNGCYLLPLRYRTPKGCHPSAIAPRWVANPRVSHPQATVIAPKLIATLPLSYPLW